MSNRDSHSSNLLQDKQVRILLFLVAFDFLTIARQRNDLRRAVLKFYCRFAISKHSCRARLFEHDACIVALPSRPTLGWSAHVECHSESAEACYRGIVYECGGDSVGTRLLVFRRGLRHRQGVFKDCCFYSDGVPTALEACRCRNVYNGFAFPPQHEEKFPSMEEEGADALEVAAQAN